MAIGCKHRGPKRRWTTGNLGCCGLSGLPAEVYECRQPDVVEFYAGECTLETVRNDRPGCDECPHYVGASADREQLVAVMRLAPRAERYVERTLDSLLATGISRGVIICEPGATPPDRTGWDIVQNETTLGSWRAFCRALSIGLERVADGGAILSLEDDVVFCRGLRRYLRRVLWPSQDAGCVSLYTASHQTTDRPPIPGWKQANEASAWGTLAQLFPPWVAAELVADERMAKWHSHCGEDQYVWRTLQAMGLSYWTATPSLAQHIGDKTAIHSERAAAYGKRKASDFVGEDTDIAVERTEWIQARGPAIVPEPPTEQQQAEVARDVAVGITHYCRPKSCREAVASVWKHWPGAEVTIVDNGNDPARFRGGVQYLQAPFDCGLSAARNMLVDTIDREFLLLLEDDMELTPYSDVWRLLDVLKSDPSVNIAGAGMQQAGRFIRYDRDFRLGPDKVLRGIPAVGDWQKTEAGTRYRSADMVLNVFVARTAFLQAMRWDEVLILSEHLEFFYRVHKTQPGCVAFVDGVWVRHHQARPSRKYNAARRRAIDARLRKHTCEKHGLANYEAAVLDAETGDAW